MRQLLEQKILPNVVKPARYTGNEWNMVKKEWRQAAVTMAFAFPDVYEVGMSHLGLHILYGLVNSHPDYIMERVFAPWVDMEEYLRQYDLPLFSLESYRPVADFDIVGFTLQYEMSYTNIINMLDLSRIPIRADRRKSGPLVIGGGPCAVNPEPLAPFFDAFLLGDSEEMLPEVLAAAARHKRSGSGDREALLLELVKIPGVYVPSFYRVEYHEDGTVREIKPVRKEAPESVRRRVIGDLDAAFFPTKPLVPNIEIVHDRMMLEVMRGCTRGCRFCQAGMIYRPVRERKQETLLQQAEELVKNTGHEEISLTSLSTADYSCIQPLTAQLLNRYQEQGINVALPSLRVDAFSVDLAREIQRVRKSGLTFAPEAGSQRLRDVINKNVTEEDLLEAVTGAFQAGWTNIKLYFMLGLPTETEEDLKELARLAKKVLNIGKQVLKQKQKGRANVTVSVSTFVPKAHTPFQFFGQNDVETIREKQQLLAGLLKERGLKFKWHDARLSFLEAVFARGDRRLAAVLEQAWSKGCRFDSWDEHFQSDKWEQVFAESVLDAHFYAQRTVPYEEMLPWEHLDTGVSKAYLVREYRQAVQEANTADCRWSDCTGCSICNRFEVENRLWREEHHAGEN